MEDPVVTLGTYGYPLLSPLACNKQDKTRVASQASIAKIVEEGKHWELPFTPPHIHDRCHGHRGKNYSLSVIFSFPQPHLFNHNGRKCAVVNA
eukprot:TRINITY_DN11950_c0_g1_i1.p1 TRINITY_DN11950_c0_g1~~TRINITY_DN11950_c0_g1_i1.p1  ORF type:complete len:103 (+),score=3.99 TRINITY_DN11950_c0_g1_i1:33-311(+)